jgi:hypothetical protein
MRKNSTQSPHTPFPLQRRRPRVIVPTQLKFPHAQRNIFGKTIVVQCGFVVTEEYAFNLTHAEWSASNFRGHIPLWGDYEHSIMDLFCLPLPSSSVYDYRDASVSTHPYL